MAYKIKVLEVVGNPDELESSIQSTMDGLTFAAGSEPSITIAGGGPRYWVLILYRDA